MLYSINQLIKENIGGHLRPVDIYSGAVVHLSQDFDKMCGRKSAFMQSGPHGYTNFGGLRVGWSQKIFDMGNVGLNSVFIRIQCKMMWRTSRDKRAKATYRWIVSHSCLSRYMKERAVPLLYFTRSTFPGSISFR